jgi:MoaA/NifB/PqqE/SkfB family radical SAM enzyme
MKLPHDKFCVLPWISLETTPFGTIKPCCLAGEEVKDENGKSMSLMTYTLDEAQQSKYMQDLRQAFINGEQPETCKMCWDEEAIGRDSKRMNTITRLTHIIKDTEWSIDAKPLIFIDFKLGNICNLKCRICGSWSSSTFAAEEVKFAGKESFHYTALKSGAWPRQNQKFWQEIDKLVDQIRYLEFTGGEPFMIQEHFDLLQRIVDKGIAGNIEIHYNTNGTQFPEHAEKIWSHFKTVEIAFSIDDVGPRFEYQRANALWDEVNVNIQKFKELQARNGNVILQVCSTVNIFNVMYLEGLANWIDKIGFDFVYWNMLHSNYYHCVSSLPEKAKQIAIYKLRRAKVTEYHRQEFNKIIDFIEAGESLDGTVFRTKTAEVDRRREQDLRTDHRLLAEAIDYTGPEE